MPGAQPNTQTFVTLCPGPTRADSPSYPPLLTHPRLYRLCRGQLARQVHEAHAAAFQVHELMAYFQTLQVARGRAGCGEGAERLLVARLPGCQLLLGVLLLA